MHLDEEQKKALDSEVTEEELCTAIKGMAKQKSPGKDGLGADWYVVFYTRIKDLLFELYSDVVREGKLHVSARQGLITLIPKPERDLKFVKNWCPIILLCSEYKFFAKILANRMKMVLPQMIHSDQTGFIKGRNIAENLQKIFDTIDYVERMNIPAILASIDMEKPLIGWTMNHCID